MGPHGSSWIFMLIQWPNLYLLFMSHKYKEDPRRVMLWNSVSSAVISPIEFTVTICCDSQLSQTFLSRANRSHVTKAQHYWEFIVPLAGATLCFNVLYFFNALLVQNENLFKVFPNWTLPQIKTFMDQLKLLEISNRKLLFIYECYVFSVNPKI